MRLGWAEPPRDGLVHVGTHRQVGGTPRWCLVAGWGGQSITWVT